MKESEKKEKPVPVKCICGKPAIIVKSKSGKMVTCADPMNCHGNMRTTWVSHESIAIAQWNSLIQSNAFGGRG